MDFPKKERKQKTHNDWTRVRTRDTWRGKFENQYRQWNGTAGEDYYQKFVGDARSFFTEKFVGDASDDHY